MSKNCASVLLACLSIALSGCGYQSPAEVKKQLEAALPAGSSKEDAVSLLESKGFENSAGFKPELYYDKSREISAVAPGKKYGVLTTARVYVTIQFDKNDRLKNIETREDKTGL